MLIFRDVITVRVLRSPLLHSDVSLPSVDFRVVPCLSGSLFSPALSVEVGLRAASWRCAAWPSRAFHGCVAGILCCRWQLVGSPLTHCGLWRSRRRFIHSVVVVFVAHSRQCSVICCMHSAGNIASPLYCTCELIRDAHCRAVAWPDGGRRTSDDSTTIIYWRVREWIRTSGVRFNGF